LLIDLEYLLPVCAVVCAHCGIRANTGGHERSLRG
jgi:hypothetical protein